jgi:hypothetical protein
MVPPQSGERLKRFAALAHAGAGCPPPASTAARVRRFAWCPLPKAPRSFGGHLGLGGKIREQGRMPSNPAAARAPCAMRPCRTGLRPEVTASDPPYTVRTDMSVLAATPKKTRVSILFFGFLVVSGSWERSWWRGARASASPRRAGSDRPSRRARPGFGRSPRPQRDGCQGGRREHDERRPHRQSPTFFRRLACAVGARRGSMCSRRDSGLRPGRSRMRTARDVLGIGPPGANSCPRRRPFSTRPSPVVPPSSWRVRWAAFRGLDHETERFSRTIPTISHLPRTPAPTIPARLERGAGSMGGSRGVARPVHGGPPGA